MGNGKVNNLHRMGSGEVPCKLSYSAVFFSALLAGGILDVNYL